MFLYNEAFFFFFFNLSNIQKIIQDVSDFEVFFSFFHEHLRRARRLDVRGYRNTVLQTVRGIFSMIGLQCE